MVINTHHFGGTPKKPPDLESSEATWRTTHQFPQPSARRHRNPKLVPVSSSAAWLAPNQAVPAEWWQGPHLRVSLGSNCCGWISWLLRSIKHATHSGQDLVRPSQDWPPQAVGFFYLSWGCFLRAHISVTRSHIHILNGQLCNMLSPVWGWLLFGSNLLVFWARNDYTIRNMEKSQYD